LILTFWQTFLNYVYFTGYSDVGFRERTAYFRAERNVSSFYISIRDDSILEYDESFVVVATLPNGLSSNATVIILDNDGKLPHI